MELKSNFKIYTEYTNYNNDFPKDVINNFLKNELCIINGPKIRFRVVGFIVFKDEFIIVFPKGYLLPKNDDECRGHIVTLLHVLMKYRKEATLDTLEMQLLGGTTGEQRESLVTAFDLIEDFNQNGLIQKELKLKSIHFNGHVDWPSTIVKKQPIVSDNTVVYVDTISNRKTIDKQHMLMMLHDYCINRSFERYGWLFDYSIEKRVIELPCDINYALNFLEMEMRDTFVEREVKLIYLMINFLRGIKAEQVENKLDVLVTPYFYNVWEAICSKLFNNEYQSLRKLIPKINWEIDSDAIVQSQRPDIMYIENDALYILDAKYYDINKNLPGWHDIVKQMFYAFTIFKNIKSSKLKFSNVRLKKRLLQITKVENMFIFPSGEKEIMKYVGKVNIENNSDFEDIKAIKINTFFSMRCYIGKEKFDYRESMNKTESIRV
ncbi:LlaJI family restriction endonuclease [Alkalihalobacillus trypoxylicola]|uniref:LlaJI family restriction endonuclease n=1 Tax=Alkalihalobacillus trypoxylicola TaxID=519424 RepID=A0A161P9H3_9BACI|nr:LlaJI family restriction endonuclease [Alkalihalobacillus trypoxylicola]KYG27720.1 hypothetical protein AZF04_11060 [Alkalihalobacillus trypoxylicola]